MLSSYSALVHAEPVQAELVQAVEVHAELVQAVLVQAVLVQAVEVHAELVHAVLVQAVDVHALLVQAVEVQAAESHGAHQLVMSPVRTVGTPLQLAVTLWPVPRLAPSVPLASDRRPADGTAATLAFRAAPACTRPAPCNVVAV